MELVPGKKVYFASDFHLGLYPPDESLRRERKIVQWLELIAADASHLFLVGDIFDFWHEYKYVVPRGFTRFLGTLARLADQGVEIHFFTGNHDIWVYDYLPAEIGLTIHRHPFISTFNGKKFFIAHGDGLGPGDYSYKLLKMLFTSHPLQWLFARIHPNTAMAFGLRWSRHSRYSREEHEERFLGADKEFQVQYACKVLEKEYFDYFLFGHRHLPLELPLENGSTVFYLGDWVKLYTYAEFDGSCLKLKKFSPAG